jgi:hypothetical protein
MGLRIIFFVISLCTFESGYAQNRFTFSPLAEKVYQASFELKLNEAKFLLARLKSEEPENLIRYYLENYIDFFSLLIGADEMEFKKREKHKNERLNAIEKGPKTSPYYRYIKAEIHLQWAFIRMNFDNYLMATREMGLAHKLLKRNVKYFPDFIPNFKGLGTIHSVMGSIPPKYKKVLKIFLGLEGTLSQGNSETFKVLKSAQNNDFLFEKETILIHAMIHAFIYNQFEYGWNFLNKYSLEEKNSPLVGYVKSYIAHEMGRNDEAIEILKAMTLNPQTRKVPYLEYLLGEYKLCRLDPAAKEHFLSFISKSNGKTNLKSAYQKLAWYEMVNGNKNGYHKYIAETKKVGSTSNSEDKAAYAESLSNKAPNEILLKSRLLFDGGYYKKSMVLLQGYEESLLTSTSSKVEYVYRVARNFHGLGQDKEALEKYSTCILIGKNSSDYYPCNAALQSGLIYETQGKKEEAKRAFNKCLQFTPSSYKSELHDKAKAGLLRIGK